MISKVVVATAVVVVVKDNEVVDDLVLSRVETLTISFRCSRII